MKLKHIELYGFKSFADKTKLEFNEDIVAVVGPNGSGKSNISDAVRWVLGEQSAKSLRGTKMEDVIFSGTQDKNQMNMAQVTITFDNQDGAINLPYDEVSVTRKVYRSGESEYRINKNSVRLKDIKELFLDTGIGKDGYSIIGQGRIEDVLSSKSEDRRYLFEEASGISKFKYQKIESTKRLEKTEENLKQVQQELKVKMQHAEILLKQAQNAKRGYKLTQELEQQELSLLQTSVTKLDQQEVKIRADYDKASVDLAEMREEQEKIQAFLAPHREVLSQIETEREQARDQLRHLELKISSREKEKSVLEEALRFQEKDSERLVNEIEMREIRFEKAESDLEEDRKVLENLQSELADIESQLKDVDANTTVSISDRENALRESREALQSLMERLNHLQFDMKQQESEHNALEVQREASRVSWAQVDREHKRSVSAFEKQEEAIQSLLVEEEKWKSDILQFENDSKDLAQIIERQAQLRQQAGQDLVRLQSEFRVLESVHKNYEGYFKPVQQLMRFAKNDPNVSSRIVGVLADMVEVKSPYEIAVDVSLGQALQNIVVKDEQDAKFLIDFMKKNQLGRITFLPINRIRGSKPERTMEPEALINATQALSFDPRIEGIVNHFLSRTTFVASIDDAIALSKRKNHKNRIVSLEGDVVNNWGSMVGGSLQKKSTGSLINRKSDLDRLTKELKESEQKLQDYEKSYLSAIDSQKVLQAKISQLNISVQRNRDQQNNLRFQQSKLSMEMQVLEGRMDNLQQIIDEESGYDKKKFEASLNLLQEERKSLETTIDDAERALQQATQSRVDMDKQRLTLESKRDWNLRETAIKQNDISSLTELMEDILSQNEQAKSSLKQLQTDVEIAYQNAERWTSELEAMHQKTLDLQQRLAEQNEKHRSMSQEIVEQDRKERSLSQSIVALEKDVYQLEIRIENFESQRQQLYDNYLSSYDLDMSSLEDRLQRLIPVEATKQRVLAIKQELSQIGYFNFDAIEQYETLQAEVDFLQQQVEDLNTSKRDIEALIKDLDKTMKEMFAVSFESINEKFNEIFRILFNGGRAELVLDGEDILSAGIEIVAQPPGKKLKSLGLLSGGERSLTAVSLLFAIFSIRPAPFCILDEIDASLDEANIGRYVKYLMSMTDSTQFILISHRKTTMEMAEVLYGVTMAEEGVSRVVKVSLKDYVEE